MLVLEHMKQLVYAAAPHLAAHHHSDGRKHDDCPDCLEFHSLWNQIKPIKYGNTVLWEAATIYTLADYQIPRDATYHIVLRVECYQVDWTNGAADLGMNEPPPPGKAYWEYIPYGTGTVYVLTDVSAQSHLLLDVDEFKIFKQGYTVALIGNFNASPDGLTRDVRTTVYGYDVGAQIVERIGGNTVIEPPSSGV
jgi:hypothetical protein